MRFLELIGRWRRLRRGLGCWKKGGINYKNNDGIMYKLNEFFIMIKDSIFK